MKSKNTQYDILTSDIKYDASKYTNDSEINNLPMINDIKSNVSSSGIIKTSFEIEVGLTIILTAELYEFDKTTDTENKNPIYTGNSDVIKVKTDNNKVQFALKKIQYELQEIICDANTVVSAICSLNSGGPHKIIVTGTINSTTISNIKYALNANTRAKVNLDLSDTTGLTSLAEQTFYECKNLISINIPSGVCSIGNSAFYGCNELISINIPDSINTIGDFTFTNCSFVSITIPLQIKTIGMYAFHDCSRLTTVNYPGTVDDWNLIEIGSCNSPLTTANINYNYMPD